MFPKTVVQRVGALPFVAAKVLFLSILFTATNQ
jgi:hypothetical protein